MNNVRTGAYVSARVGSLVRWTHPKGLTNGVVIEVRNEGQEAFIRWFDHEGHGFYPLDHQWLVLLSK